MREQAASGGQEASGGQAATGRRVSRVGDLKVYRRLVELHMQVYHHY